MVRWLRWHCPPDTGFEIRALAVWGRARYFSVTEAPHNTNFHTWMGKKQFCFFQTAETGNRTPDSGVKGSGANHYPRAPAPQANNTRCWSNHGLMLARRLWWWLNIIPTSGQHVLFIGIHIPSCLCNTSKHHPMLGQCWFTVYHAVYWCLLVRLCADMRLTSPWSAWSVRWCFGVRGHTPQEWGFLLADRGAVHICAG